jgi:hypothetical protein
MSGVFERRSGRRPASIHVGSFLSELREWLVFGLLNDFRVYLKRSGIGRGIR